MHLNEEVTRCNIQPDVYLSLAVCFYWNGDVTRAKTMQFQKCVGHTNLWQSVAENLASAVVLVETEQFAGV